VAFARLALVEDRSTEGDETSAGEAIDKRFSDLERKLDASRADIRELIAKLTGAQGPAATPFNGNAESSFGLPNHSATARKTNAKVAEETFGFPGMHGEGAAPRFAAL